MSIFKCKMCGGALEIEQGQTTCECEYCGSMQTLPRIDDDRKANLYDRANHFRRNNEFDKAAGVYERLLNEDPDDAEAYWSLVLCRYGIEYVEDPATHKRVPTVNRAQYTSIFDDDNYKQAIAYADIQQKLVYEEEAKAINEIQKGILAISQKEDPFDVFICYKETDAGGRRTMDSVLANDLYHQLTNEGFKVFFSRITLEDKLGVAYEPYIFAALNSAKVMVVLGTRPEYFNAVWVKNEWSRYLSIVKQSGGKKVLIPAYRDMDPYDLPEEFSHLQAQDMSKLGFMQDLIRGIKKILETEKPAAVEKTVVQQTVVSSSGGEVAPLYKRAQLFLEDGDFSSAAEYANRILDMDPEYAPAYMVKVLAAKKCRSEEMLENCCADAGLPGNPDMRKAIRFAEDGSSYRRIAARAAENAAFARALEPLKINVNTAAGIEACTSAAQCELKHRVDAEGTNDAAMEAYQTAAGQLKALGEYPHAEECAVLCEKLAVIMPKLNKYEALCRDMDGLKYDDNWQRMKEVSKAFSELTGFRDSAEKSEKAAELAQDAVRRLYEVGVGIIERATTYEKNDEGIAIVRLLASEILIDEAEKRYEKKKAEIAAALKAKEERQEAERKAAEEAAAKAAARKRRNTILAAAAVAVAIAVTLLITQVIIPNNHYNEAVKLMEAGQYEEAIAAFEALGDYKDSADQSLECRYRDAGVKAAAGNYQDAYAAYRAIRGYKDVDTLLSTDENLIAARDAAWQPGNYVTFGTYPQTKAETDSTPIEWLVLARDGGKALVISRYGLDAVPYNTTRTDMTWEKCSLRSWLNNDFRNTAFTAEEQTAILTTNVGNSRQGYSGYNTNGGNNTQDRIFLLSYAEAHRYFGVTHINSSNTASRIEPTAYAIARGASISSSYKTADGAAAGWWWLRSPGHDQNDAVSVSNDGSLFSYLVDFSSGCVRPALWIDLSAGIF